VAVTFDDGWRDNFTRALPTLKRFGHLATVFLVTANVRSGESVGSWDEYLCADEISIMIESGIRFESHTRTHPHLTRLSEEGVRQELSGSRRDLAALTGTEPCWLAYPYGAFSRDVARIAGECGYRGAVATIRDNRVYPSQLFWLPRVMVMESTTPDRLSYMLSWPYHLIHSLKNLRRWKGIQ
jgi:peptidoglycan/xylan/chitin deacetylase (PgdA/CDA1 family)